jgi:hypothetical protein
MSAQNNSGSHLFNSLDDFVIDGGDQSKLGSGSFATVILTRNKHDGKRYAIKTVA